MKTTFTEVSNYTNTFDVDINYYVKVNFTTVIDLVNALGGVTVYSDQAVRVYTGKKLKKGYNTLNGEDALAFARERHSFPRGDIVRGENQMNVIQSVVQKMTSKSTLMNYAEILDVKFAYSSNGKNFVEHDFLTGKKKFFSMAEFPSESELWDRFLTAKPFLADHKIPLPNN